MKLLSCLLLFAVVAMSQGHKPYYDIKDAPALFKKFIKDYDRDYINEADRLEHYKAFVQSLIEINKANAKCSGDIFDINITADYTPEERKNMDALTPPE